MIEMCREYFLLRARFWFTLAGRARLAEVVIAAAMILLFAAMLLDRPRFIFYERPIGMKPIRRHRKFEKNFQNGW